MRARKYGNLDDIGKNRRELVGIELELAGLDDVIEDCFVSEPDPFKAADLIDKRDELVKSHSVLRDG